jgi:hypothetical protein
MKQWEFERAWNKDGLLEIYLPKITLLVTVIKTILSSDLSLSLSLSLSLPPTHPPYPLPMPPVVNGNSVINGARVSSWSWVVSRDRHLPLSHPSDLVISLPATPLHWGDNIKSCKILGRGIIWVNSVHLKDVSLIPHCFTTEVGLGRVVTECASIPKITGLNPSGGSPDLLVTARGSSTWALIEFACLLCYPANTLCSQRLKRRLVGAIQIPKFNVCFYFYLFIYFFFACRNA